MPWGPVPAAHALWSDAVQAGGWVAGCGQRAQRVPQVDAAVCAVHAAQVPASKLVRTGQRAQHLRAAAWAGSVRWTAGGQLPRQHSQGGTGASLQAPLLGWLAAAAACALTACSPAACKPAAALLGQLDLNTGQQACSDPVWHIFGPAGTTLEGPHQGSQPCQPAADRRMPVGTAAQGAHRVHVGVLTGAAGGLEGAWGGTRAGAGRVRQIIPRAQVVALHLGGVAGRARAGLVAALLQDAQAGRVAPCTLRQWAGAAKVPAAAACSPW